MMAEASVDPLQRIRRALADSAEHPRRMAELDTPSAWADLLSQAFLATLKPAAVLIPVLTFRQQPSVLLTRRAELLRNHGGQISFPGGRRDDTDVSFSASALREAHEEIGLPRETVEVIGYLDDYPTLTGYRVTPVVGFVDTPFTPTPQADEVAEVFELPLADALDASRYEQHTATRDGIEYRLWELHWQSYRIWGATAAILWAFRRQVMGDG
jgi:8-oxo-dGTP pyrophosphatase MutT (NUDIX family)